MTSRKAIDEFLRQNKIAFVGVSRNKKKFGNYAFKELKAKGYSIFPVNPNMESFEGERCYPSLKELPEPVGGVLVVVPPDKTEQIVREAHAGGVKNIWIQQGAESEEAISFCKKEGMNCVYQECFLMFAEPVGLPHTIHRAVWRLIGKYPE